MTETKKNRIGLVSISFRDKTPTEIVNACKASELEVIEWGGDVHVPHGDEKAAHDVKELTEKSGLKIAEYGSYYRIGDGNEALFDRVLCSAKALGTDRIRVWCGKNIPSADYPAEDYKTAVNDARRIASSAKEMTLALECHPYTLTDEYHAALRFLEDVGCENVKMLWQPNQFRSEEYNLAAARALLPYIVGIHTFTWSETERFPLADGEKTWRKYLDILTQKPLTYLLEFMPDNRIESLPNEARTLRSWLF